LKSKYTIDHELAKKAADTIRLLCADGVQRANSGHPGMPMGMADCAFVLFSRYLKFNPKDPQWAGRDRFVLSAGHGSMLLYALLHLCGYDVTMDDLKSFRKLGSRTAGHPEYGSLPGVETTTGPLGQGFATGVGMAIAAKMAGARYNAEGFNLFGNHHIFAIVSDGDLMEGVSAEAASLAGHLGLGNLVYFYDDNQITIEGSTNLTFSESVNARFNAYGWHTVEVDGYDHEQIASAIESGMDETERPTLILVRTIIGYGSPNMKGTADVHGTPLGVDELIATHKNLDFSEDHRFYIPDEVSELFRRRVDELRESYLDWKKQYERWCKEYPGKAARWKASCEKQIPDSIEKDLIETIRDEKGATRALSGKVMQKIAERVENFCGGSADLAPSTKTYLKAFASIAPNQFEGRNLHFGIREHAMGSMLNGMALYGGLIPFGATFFVFSDYMRPAIRLAALMKIQVIYVFTHDSLFVGEDGPTHQPVEHLAALRAIPGLTVIRPADNVETALAWSWALRKTDGPTVLCLTRQSVPNLPRSAEMDISLVNRGGYILLKERHDQPHVILAATGSEVGIAVEAKDLLQPQGVDARVVSLPCLENFLTQTQEYKKSVIPSKVPVVVVEAGIVQGWHQLTSAPFLFLGMKSFGESGPWIDLAEEYGFTGQIVASQISDWMKNLHTD